jgi:hypothetical protein
VEEKDKLEEESLDLIQGKAVSQTDQAVDLKTMINEQHSFRVKSCEEVTLQGISLRNYCEVKRLNYPKVKNPK